MNRDRDLVVITGASGGIGTRLTEYLLNTGWRNIVCHYRYRRDPIAQILSKHGLDPNHRLVQADLCNEADVRAVREHVESMGYVYGLINVAGGSTNKMSWQLSTDEFRHVIDQNLVTTFHACREFTPGLRQQGRGRIINISSVVAYTGAVGASHYCAAKAAIAGFTRALALELAPRKVSVSAIALGYFQYGLIETLTDDIKQAVRDRIPVGSFGDIDSLGGLVTFLLDESGSYASGQIYHLNGGMYTG
jgi:3-oxoacyl-[acyl-carrier protein] reductase